jgi:putative DNA primase/helicase
MALRGKFVPEGILDELPDLPATWWSELEDRLAWKREQAQFFDLRLWTSPQGEKRVAIPIRDSKGRLVNIRLLKPLDDQYEIINLRLGQGEASTVYGGARLYPASNELPTGYHKVPRWVVRNEAEVITALCNELAAVCTTGDPSRWHPALSKPFRGQMVIVCFPHDELSQQEARKVAQAVAREAAGVMIFHWPADFARELLRTAGRRLCDWFRLGYSASDLLALSDSAEVVKALEAEPDGGEGAPSEEGAGRFWVLGPSGRASFRPALLAAEILKENDFITDRESGITYAYNGRHYQPLVQADLQRLALSKLGDQATIPRVNDAVGQVVALSTLPMGEGLNSRPEYLCLPNGMLNLDTLEILDHHPSYRATYMIPWEFDPKEPQDCRAFKAYLESTGNPKAVWNEVQEFAGYCLWPDCRYEKALFLVGVKGAGKSTLLEVLEWLVGEANFSAVDLEDLDKPHERAALHEKMLNIADEADSKFFSTKYFNTITSGKSLQAAFKYGHSFTFRPRCKLACSANDFPRAGGHTDAFLDRLLVVRFHRSFRGTAQQDPELADKLKAELPGIFAWAIVGLNRLRERGRFPTSQASQEAIREYRLDINNVLEFAREMVTSDPEEDGMPAEVRKDELYLAYSGWCKDSGYKPMGAALFFKRLKEAGLFAWTVTRRVTPNGRQFYLEGIRLEVRKSL